MTRSLGGEAFVGRALTVALVPAGSQVPGGGRNWGLGPRVSWSVDVPDLDGFEHEIGRGRDVGHLGPRQSHLGEWGLLWR